MSNDRGDDGRGDQKDHDPHDHEDHGLVAASGRGRRLERRHGLHSALLHPGSAELSLLRVSLRIPLLLLLRISLLLLLLLRISLLLLLRLTVPLGALRIGVLRASLTGQRRSAGAAGHARSAESEGRDVDRDGRRDSSRRALLRPAELLLRRLLLLLGSAELLLLPRTVAAAAPELLLRGLLRLRSVRLRSVRLRAEGRRSAGPAGHAGTAESKADASTASVDATPETASSSGVCCGAGG